MRDYGFDYDGLKRFRQKSQFDRIRRVAKARRSPNKVEFELWKILGPMFEYTGNGTRTVAGKRPDFICEAKRIIVELYGEYWHKDEPLWKTIERINLFKSEGYRTIIIWESELKDPNKIRRKIAL